MYTGTTEYKNYFSTYQNLIMRHTHFFSTITLNTLNLSKTNSQAFWGDTPLLGIAAVEIIYP